MRFVSLMIALMFAWFSPTIVAQDSTVSLFNGQNLDGWRKAGGEASYEIDGECIVGKVGPGPNTFLCTEKEYANFRFSVDLKLDVRGNSGIQFRSHQRENGRVFGYQMEIDPSDRAWSGGIYDEGRRGWLFPLTGLEEARSASAVRLV